MAEFGNSFVVETGKKLSEHVAQANNGTVLVVLATQTESSTLAVALIGKPAAYFEAKGLAKGFKVAGGVLTVGFAALEEIQAAQEKHRDWPEVALRTTFRSVLVYGGGIFAGATLGSGCTVVTSGLGLPVCEAASVAAGGAVGDWLFTQLFGR